MASVTSWASPSMAIEVGVFAVGPAPAHDDRRRRIEVLAGLVAIVGMDELVPYGGVVEEALGRHAEDRDSAVAHVLEAPVGHQAEPVADEVAGAFDQKTEPLVGRNQVPLGGPQPLVARLCVRPVARAGLVCHPCP